MALYKSRDDTGEKVEVFLDQHVELFRSICFADRLAAKFWNKNGASVQYSILGELRADFEDVVNGKSALDLLREVMSHKVPG